MAYYEEHPVFYNPENIHATIWRYMSFSKFISILDKNALYFSVANKLEDKWEGTLPYKNKENMEESIISFFEQARASNAINCWHMREVESASMWKSYVNDSDGIAIKSSFSRLTECFKEIEAITTYKLPLHVGVVKYINFENETIDSSNSYTPLLYKREFFEDEREVRAIIGGGILDTMFIQGVPGIYVPVDLEILIESVYVDPVAQDWFFELIKSLVGERYDVKRSSIGNLPLKSNTYPPVRAYTMVKKKGKNWKKI